MKKNVIRVVAGILATATVITGYPTCSAYAVTAASILPTEGSILATGEGVSIKDIKAEKARNIARSKAQTIHDSVSEEVMAEDKKLVASATGNLDVSVKAETPASKAVKQSETVNGVSIVGSAATAASMTVSEMDEDLLDFQSANSSDASVSGNSVSGNSVSGNSVDNQKGPNIEVSLASNGVSEGEEDLSRMVIAQVSYYVNVRKEPNEDSEVVGKLYNNSAGEWLDKDGDWYKIKSGNVTGYVKGEFVVSGQAAVELAEKVGERVAVVNTTTLKVREDANTEAPVLGLVPMEDRLTVLEETDEWVKVSIEEGDGWVSKEFVSVSTEFPKAESKAEEEARLRKEEEARRKANAAAAAAAKKNKSKGGKGGKSSGGGSYSASGSGAGSSVANYALQFVGNPYVFGGSSLTSGTDCSGFVMSVYRNYGVSLPHSSGAQRSCGYSVGGLANAQAGDIVCYSGHVGIYIGGGQIVHASTAKTGIKVSNASYRNVLDVRRIF